MSTKPRCLPAPKAEAGIPALEMCCCPRGFVCWPTRRFICAAQSVGVWSGWSRGLALRFCWFADILFIPWVLVRRSATLRTYAGDTSLPGGKVDPEDKSIEDTAVRDHLQPFSSWLYLKYFL
jgi:hypothetical protein